MELPWLLLIHQIPPDPAYLRVKIWRRLNRVGAVAIKNSVYVMPAGDSAREDFEWTRQEVVRGGGEASICEARFIEGLEERQIQALFHAARDVDYAQLAADARALVEARDEPTTAELARLAKRLEEIVAIDFFGAPGRTAAEATLLAARARTSRHAPAEPASPGDAFRGRTWVTRRGIHVDRIASAWLIRRFIDPEATFRYVAQGREACGASELRFDMFEAEFTHEGDECTFEVLVRRFGLPHPPLGAIAEIIHDLDLKDGKFQRPEAAGVAVALAGIVGTHDRDEDRLSAGADLFDQLFVGFGGSP